MICSHSACSNTENNDNMIACWICNHIFHTKCICVPSHLSDDINGNFGLRWCCNNCRKFDTDFYKSVKSHREKFIDIKKNFLLFLL